LIITVKYLSMNIHYSLVIPCFNEAACLPTLISEMSLATRIYNIEFILVDNGSNDSTPEIFNTISNKNIMKIRLENNLGYGGGIKAGLAKAHGNYVGWTHADLQYSLTDSLKCLNNNYSYKHFIKGRRKGRNIFQKFISANMSLFETILFGHLLYDINAQPTIFHKDLLGCMRDIPDDFSIDLYSYVTARKFKFKVFRFNVKFVKRNYGKSSWNTGIKSIFKMSIKTLRYSLNLKRNL